MKNIIEISNDAKIYKLIFYGDAVIENEKGETMIVSEKDLFDIIDEHFQREF